MDDTTAAIARMVLIIVIGLAIYLITLAWRRP